MIKTVKLEELASVKGGKRLPKGVNLITTPNSHPYIRVRDLNNRHTLELNADFEYVDEETQKNIARYIVDRGDIVLSIVGTIGLVAIVGDSLHHANLTENCVKLTQLNGVNRDYLYYFLKSELGQAEIAKGTVGAVQAKLPIKNIQAIEVVLPSLELQEKIASILAAIDYKIEANEKINDNLQQQMSALFDSWFVKYVPFGGSCPSNWQESDVYSIADIIYGAPFTSKLFNTVGEGKPIIRIRDLKDQQFATFTTECHPKGYLLQHGDIVVGMDGEFRPYIWANDEAWLNQRVCVFANKRQHGKAFLYFTIKPLLYRIEQTQVATTVIHIGKKDYDAFRFMLPSSDVLDRFDEITAPMISHIVSNGLENMRLAALRDALLPKLISGEVDVSDLI